MTPNLGGYSISIWSQLTTYNKLALSDQDGLAACNRLHNLRLSRTEGRQLKREKTTDEPKTGFFQTLSRILTAIAAVIGSIAALVGILYQSNLLSKRIPAPTVTMTPAPIFSMPAPTLHQHVRTPPGAAASPGAEEEASSDIPFDLEVVSIPDSFGTAARAISLNGSVHHRVMDLFKIKTQLGYRDLIPAVEAIARTARWYVEHPPEHGGEIEQRLQDPFDYEAEDKLIAILQEARERAQAITTHQIEAIPHPYPHPKEPNLQRDHRNR